MKRTQMLAVCLLITFYPCMTEITAQDVNGQIVNDQPVSHQEVSAIDLKLDLAETKLELLDSRIRLWEEKPAALERDLQDLEQQIRQLSFSPEQFNEKFILMDSMLREQRLIMAQQQAIMDRISESGEQAMTLSDDQAAAGLQRSPDTSYPPELTAVPSGKYVISIYPIRIFEGTMQLSLEWILNRGNSLEISAMATYAAREGLANYYLSNQKLDYYNASLDSYVPYESENITGYGTALSWRNYLLPRTRPNYVAPKGAYAAPSFMYRRLTLSGFDYVFNEETGVNEQVEVEQYLNIFSGGILAGWQFVLWNALTADIYVGGMVRLSKYDGNSGFTKYKEVSNIDFSGVMPTFGLKIGIVK